MAFRSLGYRRNCLPRKCTKKSQFASVNYKLLYTFCKVGKNQWWSSHVIDEVVYHVQYNKFASYDCAVAAEGGPYPSPPQAAHCRVCIRACVKSIYVLRRTLYVHILPSVKTDANANDDIRLQAVQTIESRLTAHDTLLITEPAITLRYTTSAVSLTTSMRSVYSSHLHLRSQS